MELYLVEFNEDSGLREEMTSKKKKKSYHIIVSFFIKVRTPWKISPSRMVSLWLAICIGKDEDVKCQKRSSRLLGALCKETGALKWKCQSFVCDWEDFVHWESISWGVQRGRWETGEDNEVLKRTGNGFLQNEAPATLSLCFHSLMSPGSNSVGQRFIAYRV